MTDSQNAWDTEFQRLRERFPREKDTILFCAHVLQQSGDQEPSLEDLKAQARMHGLRITGASLNAARTLVNPSTAAPRRGGQPAMPPPPAERSPRRERPTAADRNQDDPIEQLVRLVVDKLWEESDSRVSRMRRAIEDALRLIDEALQP